MSDTINDNHELKAAQRKKLDRKLDTAGWALFFIWMGIAILADVGWGVGFLGIGLIILGGLTVREFLTDSSCSRTTKQTC
jgi:hypothetical protein